LRCFSCSRNRSSMRWWWLCACREMCDAPSSVALGGASTAAGGLVGAGPSLDSGTCPDITYSQSYFLYTGCAGDSGPATRKPSSVFIAIAPIDVRDEDSRTQEQHDRVVHGPAGAVAGHGMPSCSTRSPPPTPFSPGTPADAGAAHSRSATLRRFPSDAHRDRGMAAPMRPRTRLKRLL
jgi:hypothetical protein